MRAYYEVWKRSFLVPAGVTHGYSLYRVTAGHDTPSRTVSEGQGYGMMIVAFLAGHDPDAQALFDGLWRFVRKNPSGIDSRLMSFEVPPMPPPGAVDSAFDGDCDIAHALLLADAQWGSDGSIDYRGEAEILIAAILESTIGPQSRLPMLGDWTQPDGEKFNQYTPRSSDFIPDHFRAFELATGNPAWSQVVAETQSVITSLQETHSPSTGLLPDFIVPVSHVDHTPKPAPPDFLEAPEDGNYFFNAGRVPWRLGIDALLHGDPISMKQARRITRWACASAEGDPYQIHAGYQLDGTPLDDLDFTTFFAAPLGVAAMTDPAQQDWLNRIYEAVYSRHEDYYEDTVTLLCLLAMSENVWAPGSRELAAKSSQQRAKS